jgi:CRISPR-associated protein Cas1
LLKIESKEDDYDEAKNLLVSPLDFDVAVVSGEHDITTGAIRLLLKNEIELIILDSFGNPVGYILPCGKSRLIERYEAQSRISPSRALNIAKAMCIASMTNKISLLRSIQKNTGVDIETHIESIRRMTGQAEPCQEANSLQGFEGFSTNEYYSALMKIIPASFNFTGRNRNPPMDPFNSLLGYGYGILYSRIRSAIVKAGLSPYYGVFHASYKNQEALVYDLIEEFRQPIVDRVVLTLIARKQVSPEDFNVTDEGCFFKNNFKKKYAGIILTRLEQEYTYDNEKKTFSEIIEVQADSVASAILETGKYSPFIYR